MIILGSIKSTNIHCRMVITSGCILVAPSAWDGEILNMYLPLNYHQHSFCWFFEEDATHGKNWLHSLLYQDVSACEFLPVDPIAEPALKANTERTWVTWDRANTTHENAQHHLRELKFFIMNNQRPGIMLLIRARTGTSVKSLLGHLLKNLTLSNTL